MTRDAEFGTLPTRRETFTAGGFGSPSEAIRAQAGTQIPTGRTELDLPAPAAEQPKRFVIVDNQGRVVNVLEVPAGTELRTVTPPSAPAGPKTVAIVNPRTGQIIRQFQVPAGTQIVSAPTGGAAGGVSGGLGGEIPTGGALPQGQVVRVYPIYKKGTKILTHYGIQMQNGQVMQFTRQQAESEVKRMIGVGDPRWNSIARGIGLSPKVTDQWKFGAKGDVGRKKEIAALQANLRQVETDMLVAGNVIKAAGSLQDKRKAEADLRALTIRRAQLLKRLGVLGGGGTQPVRGVGIPPAAPDDLSDLYR